MVQLPSKVDPDAKPLRKERNPQRSYRFGISIRWKRQQKLLGADIDPGGISFENR